MLMFCIFACGNFDCLHLCPTFRKLLGALFLQWGDVADECPVISFFIIIISRHVFVEDLLFFIAVDASC